MSSSRVQWIVITVLCAALGVLTSLLVDARTRLAAVERPSADAAAPSSGGARTDGAGDDAMHAGAPRDGIERDIADLRLRVAALERSAHLAPPSADAAANERASDDARDDAGDASAAGGAAAPLARAVRQELEKVDAERESARSERWRQRTVEKITAFADENKLSGEQKAKLTEMVDAETQEIRGLFRDARDSGDFSSVRDQARALRAKTEENAKAILDDDQFAAFMKMRDEERQRFGGNSNR